jgi:hypothetical protein
MTPRYGEADRHKLGNLDRRIVLALMSIAFIVADVLASFAPNIGVLLLGSSRAEWLHRS